MQHLPRLRSSWLYKCCRVSSKICYGILKWYPKNDDWGVLRAILSLPYFMVGPLVLNLLFDPDNSLVNSKITECQKKVSRASAFLPLFHFVSQSSAFWHQGQSGTAGHGLVRHCPAMEMRSSPGRRANLWLLATPRSLEWKNCAWLTWNPGKNEAYFLWAVTLVSMTFLLHRTEGQQSSWARICKPFKGPGIDSKPGGPEARIFKRLWSPRIDSKEWIPPAYVALRAVR